jgi:Bacterial Ig-like domain (group 3)
MATTPAISFATVGSYTVTANYQGDAVFSQSGSGGTTVTVQKLPAVLQLSPPDGSIGIGGGYSAYIFIPDGSGSTAPGATGTIQLYSNGVALGSPFAVTPDGTTATASSPPNIFSTAGTYTITASYSGDADWMASTSTGVSLTVLPTPASYGLSVGSPTMTFPAGDRENNVNGIDVFSQLGFVGTVNVNCSVISTGGGSVPGAPTCSLSSNSVTFPFTVPNFPVLTINTTARSNSSAAEVSADGRPKRAGWRGTREVALCALLLCLVPVSRRSWRALAMLAFLGVGFTMLSGCGPSKGSSTPTPVGTPAGSYTVTVSASSSVAGVPAPPPVTIALTIN